MHYSGRVPPGGCFLAHPGRMLRPWERRPVRLTEHLPCAREDTACLLSDPEGVNLDEFRRRLRVLLAAQAPGRLDLSMIVAWKVKKGVSIPIEWIHWTASIGIVGSALAGVVVAWEYSIVVGYVGALVSIAVIIVAVMVYWRWQLWRLARLRSGGPKPLRCRLHFHAWSVWDVLNDYARYEPVPGAEGLIVLRYFLERQCLACGETGREYGEESRVTPEDAIALDLITEHERKTLRKRPLADGAEQVPSDRPAALLCRLGFIAGSPSRGAIAGWLVEVAIASLRPREQAGQAGVSPLLASRRGDVMHASDRWSGAGVSKVYIRIELDWVGPIVDRPVGAFGGCGADEPGGGSATRWRWRTGICVCGRAPVSTTPIST